ncbi:Electron transfer flavoprotein, alpha subunit [Syntrophomonas zehnderi OL-4]|uniref:Electron transfer flavoprotein, alpha subunit n=1 Tax=Syntrophomonas zehnderi OL-4 TaxID=690567 RepID=A0A0E4C9L6_9FIRM|nr:electron transfer flavoprotein subunit alpha/FixB family protein [Syntrophomonas zehnderi]CFY03099.1 Electron transfer flavoprotein, alpha subunit [Syntrophomonas zehnderi OL-4]
MAGILIYSDKTPYALELVTAGQIVAKDLGLPLQAVSINDADQAVELGKRVEVYKIANDDINLADTAAVASALKQTAEQVSANIILLSSNRRGKEVAGRLAQSLQAGCLSDVNSFTINSGKIECSRNALGGATVAVQQIETANQVIAIMPKAFEKAPEGSGSLHELTVEVRPRIKVLEVKPKAGDSVDIEAADILVAVGQGLENQGDLAKVEAIAKALGGEVACSKPIATDKKWLSEERIIGLSGKKCKPSLAIVMGISGQVQFTVGIRDAKTIVAVNNDENADIMRMADYIMVADLEDVLPELIQALS